ncbi:MAG: tyrosine-type recombinase/integrase, partial [Firmicutes bacterium]|nr:tyrosine-type recombinase/integrase [Bacillota bacterium]
GRSERDGGADRAGGGRAAHDFVECSDAGDKGLSCRLSSRAMAFPGAEQSQHLTARTVERVLETARLKAGIPQHFSVHALRHSFAVEGMEAVEQNMIRALREGEAWPKAA